MRLPVPPLLHTHSSVSNWLSRRLSPGLTMSWLLLAAIVLLAAWLRFTNLEAIGDGNQYYSAAVASMLQSWQNFLFIAAEPGGSVTVDKPPVGLWLQAISAYFLGVNGFALALPQILAGLASIVLLFHLVRRCFGNPAGLLAALILAITPVAIATERNNTMDATLVFVLLLAAWGFIRASDTGRRGYLLLAALLVGIGFNIKMLQAFLPLPAFYALYVFGAQLPWRRKLLDLTLATLLLVAVSLSWAIAVDLTPVDQRPYIGSSSNNTVMELIIGHNGVSRLIGGSGVPGADGQLRPEAGSGQPGLPQPGLRPGQNGPFPPPDDAGAGPPAGSDAAGAVQAAPGLQGETGSPGALRLFQSPLANEVSWLLPSGLLAIFGMGLGLRVRRPLGNLAKAVILWGGWLLTSLIFFSVASFYHAYYLIMLGAPLAALVAIGLLELWKLRQSRPNLATLLLITAGLLTLAYQLFVVQLYTSLNWWLVIPLICLFVGSLLLLLALRTPSRRLAPLGLVLLLSSVLSVPAAWSLLTTLDPQPDVALPHAYSGEQNSGPGSAIPAGARQANQELISYLQENTRDVEYLLVVPSANIGAAYVLETGRPVLYAGGFNGSDTVITADDLAQLVAEGRVRYVLWNTGDFGPQSGNSTISSYLQSYATPVEAFNNLAAAGPQARLQLYRLDG